MESDTGREERDHEDHDHTRQNAGTDTSAAEAALKAKLSRKRTKTGCLTCRKRRIKCGEERPVCRNCVKSKRHCEGYNQRVVFRPPTFEYEPMPNNGGAHIVFQAGPVLDRSMQALGGDPSTYTQLRPRLVDQHVAGNRLLHQHVADGHDQHFQQPSGRNSSPRGARAQHLYPAPGQDQRSFIPPTVQGQQRFNHASRAEPTQDTAMEMEAPLQMLDRSPANNNQPSGMPATARASYQYDMALNNTDMYPMTSPESYSTQMLGQMPQHFTPNRDVSNTMNQQWAGSEQAFTFTSDHEFVAPTPLSSHSSGSFSHSQQTSLTSPQQWAPATYIPRADVAHTADYHTQQSSNMYQQPILTPTTISQTFQHLSPEYYEHEEHFHANLTPTTLLNTAAVEAQDDDYYDIGSDEEIDFDTSAVHTNGYQRQRTLSKILALNQISIRELQVRRYDTFIYEGILDHYRVEEVANPLRNPATARVFAHFISATGPSLSIFERHPRNTSVLFTEGTVPLSQQGLWTYTMPMAALRHQGLLHAMLALASLHIARLQGASVTPSMRHYAWSLKRIHKAVGNPSSRLKLTTMAASMLLGFYEVMTADHMKWNMHLAGSKQLFVETDFAGMTREVRRMKMEKAARQFHQGEQNRYSPDEPLSRDDLLDQIPDIDERLVSLFTGKEVRYDDHGMIEHHGGFPPSVDLNKFEILKDLYWWYCKQDVYQSIVSGNNLLMDFSRWSNCPPRAPLGKIDAIYGTFDHLVLLLGRIADFSARDRVRKLKQMESTGGQWRPAPGMNIPRPTPSPPANSQPPMPMFYGMAPPPRSNVQMPSSYTPLYNGVPESHNPYPTNTMDYDLKAATQTALEEYGRIREALHTFATSLGEAFEPLSSEYQAPLDTPFGPALFYRSYDIGCLWSIYNMATIIAIRAHPHMPPASHTAAGVAAHETAFFANEIGRIAAGIVPGPPDQPLNPSLGATLCESCLPSFFAAVQYQDPRQRRETVTRIYSIARRTGWGSAELIANGCETSWVKAAAMGRGPPYQRIARPEYSDDPRLNGSWERMDPNAMPEIRDERDRRLVKVSENARLNWAIGVMGIEDDMEGTVPLGGMRGVMR